ncbi:MAG: GGDEF and EAL domain-containing protein [Corticimicrobacter sp.]|uniref:bifunctional diguanylate cyclase/phosphodiesterase n=1 Tax=Corticimicrobacter sp. TaxID=2678536 RepID=UPI0032DA0B95
MQQAVPSTATHSVYSLAHLAAMDRIMAIAEFDVNGQLQHANDNYLNLLGLTAENAAGRSYISFCQPEFVDRGEYESFWNKLLAGQSHSGLAERLRDDGRQCWLEATYIPMPDDNGQIQRILKIATDITQRIERERDQQKNLHLLSLVADASDAAVMITDHSSEVIYINSGFTRMFGWNLEEIRQRSAIPLLAPNLDDEYAQNYRATLRNGHSIEREELLTSKDRQRCWAKIFSNPIFDIDGNWQYTITVLTDITIAKVHEMLQRQTLEHMARDRPLTEVLETICHEVERIAPELCASILEIDEHGKLHPLAAPSLPADYCQALDGLSIGPCVGSCGTAAWLNEPVRVDDIATDPRWAPYRELVLPLGLTGCWSTPIRNSIGRVIGSFAFYFRRSRDDSSILLHQRLVDACTHLCALALEREHSRTRIRQLAFYDELTGMPNRNLLHAKADQSIAAATRDRTPLAVLFIDLDRFKQINDSLGHPAGDEVLRQISERLQRSPEFDIQGRLAGDEFIVVLPRQTAEQAALTIEQIQAELAAPIAVAGTTLSISASVGVAMFPTDGHDMETLLHRADIAMYQAKRSGRGHCSFYSSEMNQLAQERMALESALRQALENSQLHLHYQPQIEMSTGELYGVEALARWSHPGLGDISPARFIPLAEECGLIADLGRWAVGEACRQLAQWRTQGLAIPAVSVNLSPTSFHNLELPSIIASTLQQHALKPEDLTLEITENILLDTNPGTMKTISEVQAQGVRLSMDDFGTGYSSLSYLRRLPISELKLDRSFVADLENDEAAQALSRAILGIGQSLRLTVVAEGIETQAQNLMLREQGYPVAQGYLFSKPLAPSDLERWLAERVVAH